MRCCLIVGLNPAFGLRLYPWLARAFGVQNRRAGAGQGGTSARRVLGAGWARRAGRRSAAGTRRRTWGDTLALGASSLWSCDVDQGLVGWLVRWPVPRLACSCVAGDSAGESCQRFRRRFEDRPYPAFVDGGRACRNGRAGWPGPGQRAGSWSAPDGEHQAENTRGIAGGAFSLGASWVLAFLRVWFGVPGPRAQKKEPALRGSVPYS